MQIFKRLFIGCISVLFFTSSCNQAKQKHIATQNVEEKKNTSYLSGINLEDIVIPDKDYTITFSKELFKNPILIVEGDTISGNAKIFNDEQMLLETVPFYKGVRHGKSVVTTYAESLRNTCNYVLGKKEGEEVQWFYNDTVIASKLYFKNGLKSGESIQWFPNGKVQIQELFLDDELIAKKQFSPSGEIIKNYVIKDGRQYGLAYSSFCQNGIVRSPDDDDIEFYSK